MPGRAVLLGPLALAVGLAGAAVAQAPPGAADIGVTVGPGGAVRVEETYVLPAGLPAVELRALMRPCADVRNVRVERSGSEVRVLELRRGPWLVFRDTMGVGGDDTLHLRVRYEVHVTGGRADVPLLHLTAPVPQRDGAREGTVRLVVGFAEAGGRVLFPHMDQRSPTAWEASYVGVPSFVTVSVAGRAGARAPDCAASGGPAGDNGGLVWRFLVLVGIMVAWVPLYLAWARRTGEGAE